MNSTQEKLGISLLKNLINLREQKGQLLIEDVGALMQGMASSLSSETPPDNFIRSEMEKIVQYIAAAKAEIASMVPNPDEESPKNINNASMELDEVVKATEKATNTIMDAADNIQNLASGLADAETGGKIIDETMKLYDACSFQDITGQRINKVLKTIDFLEGRIVRLVDIFGGSLPEGYVPPKQDHHDRPDEKLMRGPQLTGETPSQNDIDALFDSI